MAQLRQASIPVGCALRPRRCETPHALDCPASALARAKACRRAALPLRRCCSPCQPKAQILLCLRLWGRVVLGILTGGAGLDGLLVRRCPVPPPLSRASNPTVFFDPLADSEFFPATPPPPALPSHCAGPLAHVPQEGCRWQRRRWG